MAISRVYQPIRRLVASLFSRNAELQHNLYSTGSIARLCNHFVGGGIDEDIVITDTLVVDSFKGGGPSWIHFELEDLMTDADGGVNTLSCLKFRSQSDRATKYVIGCFGSESAAIDADPDNAIDLSTPVIRRMDLQAPSSDVITDVREMIKAKKKNDALKKRNARKNEKRKSGELEVVDENDNPQLLEPAPPTSEQIKAACDNQEALFRDLVKQQRELALRVESEREKFLSLRRQVFQVVPQCDVATNNDTADTQATTSIADNALLFIRDGRPGALNVSDGDVFLAEDIDNAILSEDTTCSASGYSLGWFGKKACWVPSRAKLTGSWYLSWLRSYIEPVKKLHNFYHSKYTGFKGRASRILSIFCLRASGASDAAKESIICGTIKALMHQIGFDKFITHEQLARASPCQSTFGNWELKLASWYYALNIWEILKEKDRTGKPVILALMTDHGNRKGSGFFAKLLVWCQCEDGE
jgi:hypothetical protein